MLNFEVSSSYSCGLQRGPELIPFGGINVLLDAKSRLAF